MQLLLIMSLCQIFSLIWRPRRGWLRMVVVWLVLLMSTQEACAISLLSQSKRTALLSPGNQLAIPKHGVLLREGRKALDSVLLADATQQEARDRLRKGCPALGQHPGPALSSPHFMRSVWAASAIALADLFGCWMAALKLIADAFAPLAEWVACTIVRIPSVVLNATLPCTHLTVAVTRFVMGWLRATQSSASLLLASFRPPAFAAAAACVYGLHRFKNSTRIPARPPASSAPWGMGWLYDAIDSCLDYHPVLAHTRVKGSLSSGRVTLDLHQIARVRGLMVVNCPCRSAGKYGGGGGLVLRGCKRLGIEVSLDGRHWTRIHTGWLLPGYSQHHPRSQFVMLARAVDARFLRLSSLLSYKGVLPPPCLLQQHVLSVYVSFSRRKAYDRSIRSRHSYACACLPVHVDMCKCAHEHAQALICPHDSCIYHVSRTRGHGGSACGAAATACYLLHGLIFVPLGPTVLLPLQSLPEKSDVQCAGGDAY